MELKELEDDVVSSKRRPQQRPHQKELHTRTCDAHGWKVDRDGHNQKPLDELVFKHSQ